MSLAISEWIRDRLPYLEKMGLIKQEKDSFIVYVDEFKKRRGNEDTHKLYAKLECKIRRQAKHTKRPSLPEAESLTTNRFSVGHRILRLPERSP